MYRDMESASLALWCRPGICAGKPGVSPVGLSRLDFSGAVCPNPGDHGVLAPSGTR